MHEFLLKGGPPPECIPCNCPLTIKHLLIECVDFNKMRPRFYQVPSLQDLFKTVKRCTDFYELFDSLNVFGGFFPSHLTV